MAEPEYSAPIPAAIGPFEILRALGDGGSARVYLARHPRLDVPVALKVLHPVSHSPFASEMLTRFTREARIAARLVHPNIVRTFDVEVEGTVPYIVMEYVPGRSLSSLLGRQRLSPRRALEIARDVTRGLICAHDCGVVHRDIKPANIVIDRRGTARIVDFGVSRLRMSDEGLTQTGQILGTPQYMAPEQISEAPDDVDGRADLFALGVVLYEMLTAHHPFRGKNLLDTLKRIGTHQPASPAARVAGIPARVDQLTMRCLSKEAAGRPRSAAELLKEIEEALAQIPATPSSQVSSSVIRVVEPPRRSRSRPLALVALAAVSAVGIHLWASYAPEQAPAAKPAAVPQKPPGFRSPLAIWHGEQDQVRTGGTRE